MDKYKLLPLFHFSEEIRKHQKRKRMKCLVFGNFGAMNYGDEAILSGQLGELAKIDHVSVAVVGRFPKEITRLHKVRTISFYSSGKVIKEIRRSDFIIVGGGGLICKVDRSLIGFFYQLYLLALSFLFPILYKKKIYVLGIGIYKNTNPIILHLATTLLRFTTLITVRDHHSYELLNRKKIPSELYKDNSFLMQIVPPISVLEDTYFKRLYNRRKKHIGISLVRPTDKKEEKQLLSELVKFIAKNAKTVDFWFYSADYHSGYFNDENFGHLLHIELKKKIGHGARFYFIPTNWDPQRFFSSIVLMDFFISMRLHTSIFSYRQNVPFLGISYDEKCTSFLEAIGKKPLQIHELRWKTLQEAYDQAVKKRDTTPGSRE